MGCEEPDVVDIVFIRHKRADSVISSDSSSGNGSNSDGGNDGGASHCGAATSPNTGAILEVAPYS